MLLCNTNILIIGGFDPSGAAGVLADARMVSWLGGHPSALVSVQTVQNRISHRSSEAEPLPRLQAQWDALEATAPKIAAVKIGALANPAQARWLAGRLADLDCPIVLDPVISSSAGTALSAPLALKELAPLASIITPNRAEALQLFGCDRAAPVWSTDCPAPLLITGTDQAQHEGHPHIVHRLLTSDGLLDLPTPLYSGRYRGSGCLLASALACQLAAGRPLPEACRSALDAVEAWLQAAWLFDDGIHLPRAPGGHCP